jgi:hemerythrin-like metal-binding protein
MPLVWTAELATGNRQIDEQHRRLFQLFGDLQDAIERHEGEEELGRTLTALAVYVVAHFRMEEDLMRRYGYAGLEAHCEAHRFMRVQVEAMIDHYKDLGLDPVKVQLFLEEWLIIHVQDDDRAMAQFLVSCGQGALAD